MIHGRFAVKYLEFGPFALSLLDTKEQRLKNVVSWVPFPGWKLDLS